MQIDKGISLTKVELDRIEANFLAAWTGDNSTPFIVDAPISASLRTRGTAIVRQTNLYTLFQLCPTLATWAVLTPLAIDYGASSNDVYSHISVFTNKSFDDAQAREKLKERFRFAARRIGLPVTGNQPTELFFAPLGPARSQLPDMARAFVGAALHLGPPAVEDTPSARDWQRRAVATRCPNLTRLNATISFDRSAYCARRFEAWRRGNEPLTEAEALLFAAYDQAVSGFGRHRSDLVAPPRLFWNGFTLALEAEPSQSAQSIKLGPFPTQLPGGSQVAIRTPWPERITWTAGSIAQDIEVAPALGEILVFDADSGVLLTRTALETKVIAVASERQVVIASEQFGVTSFGPSIQSADPGRFIAWTLTGDELNFPGRLPLGITSPVETALWINADTIGRDGARILLASDGELILKIDPDVGGPIRILRARFGDAVRYVSADAGLSGIVCTPLSAFGLHVPGDPVRVTFEALAPGAAGDLQARSEIFVTGWIWQGVSAPSTELCDVPVPGNIDRARSAGLKILDGKISIDPRSEAETAILGIRDGGTTREFRLTARGEKLWHYRVGIGDRVFVPMNGRILLGHNGRHDTLLLRSSDKDADLFVLGNVLQRPFLGRQQLEIGAEKLEANDNNDDRIALRRRDGKIDVLARLQRVNDPTSISVDDQPGEVVLRLIPQSRFDALMIRIDDALGGSREGAVAFGYVPVDAPLPHGVRVLADVDTGAITIRLAKRDGTPPSRALFWLRSPETREFAPLEDAAGASIAIATSGPIAAPDALAGVRLAKFLAEPAPIALDGHMLSVLGPIYKRCLAEVAGPSKIVGRILPILNVSRTHHQPPRHDLFGVAPWIFECPLYAFRNLSEGSGLWSLSRMTQFPELPDLPDPRGELPLAAWVRRMSEDPTLPPAAGASALQHGFRALRYRLRDTDLRDLVTPGPLAISTLLICDTYVDMLEALRSFDDAGGGDPRVARIAATLERLARACACHEAEDFLSRVSFRTGLDRSHAGQTLTMMIRAGAEIFSYFRALWHHAILQNEKTS
ncbi:hypothetical protein [Ensifer adhaerens]|uniref:hypothetical protein n=1 Tax=Ensifer adhaerens TaxID=106592 RepID=UPI00128F7943|nr:hypothetical protein [Ensifer adhaerens]